MDMGQQSTTGTSTQAPSSASRYQQSQRSQSSQGTSNSNKPVVRMVSMHHIGDPPTSFPEEFALSEDSEEIEIDYFGRILRVTCEESQEERKETEEFWIGDEDESQECEELDDTLYHWYGDEQEQLFVRTARQDQSREIEVVLDSGADISLAPMWMKRFGRKAPEKAQVVLRDAQGKLIKVSDQRIIEVEFRTFQELP